MVVRSVRGELFVTYRENINDFKAISIREAAEKTRMSPAFMLAPASPPAEFHAVTVYVKPAAEDTTGTVDAMFEVMIDAFEMAESTVTVVVVNFRVSGVAYTILLTVFDGQVDEMVDAVTAFSDLTEIFFGEISSVVENNSVSEQ